MGALRNSYPGLSRRGLKMLAGAGLMATTALTFAPAHAAPATEQGARDLQARLEAFLGDDEAFRKGIVRIVPAGESYDFIVDPNKGESKSKPSQPLPVGTVHVTPKDDGTYAFIADPLSYSGSSPDTDDPKKITSVKLTNCVANGVFNPKDSYLSTVSAGCDAVSIKAPDAKDPIDFDMGKFSLAWSGVEQGATADLKLSVAMSGLTVIFPDEKKKDQLIHFKIGDLRYDLGVEAARAHEIADLLMLARSSEGMGKKKPLESEVLAKAKAALPLWNMLKINSEFTGISVESDEVSVKLEQYAERQALSGVAKDSNYQVDMNIAGLTVASPQMPPQATPLLPGKAGIGLKISGLDLDSAAKTIFDNPSPSNDAVQGALMSLLFKGDARITANVNAAAAAYDFDGHAEAPIDLKLQGNGVFSMRGFDDIVAAVGKLNSPDAANANLGLALIKGLAKSGEDGRLVWNVSVDGLAKKFTVNGQTFDLPEK